jgi:hypothetical protein
METKISVGHVRRAAGKNGRLPVKVVFSVNPILKLNFFGWHLDFIGLKCYISNMNEKIYLKTGLKREGGSYVNSW